MNYPSDAQSSLPHSSLFYLPIWTELPCHTPIPGPTRLADPNRVRGARLRTGTLYLIFFFTELVPVGMAHILQQNQNIISKELPPEWCPSKSILIYRVSFTNTKLNFYIYKSKHGTYCDEPLLMCWPSCMRIFADVFSCTYMD